MLDKVKSDPTPFQDEDFLEEQVLQASRFIFSPIQQASFQDELDSRLLEALLDDNCPVTRFSNSLTALEGVRDG
jgi:hypothetical protein